MRRWSSYQILRDLRCARMYVRTPAPTSTHPSTTESDVVRLGLRSVPEFPATTNAMPARMDSLARSLANRCLDLAQWETASPELQGALLKRIGPRLNPAFQLRYGTATSRPCRPRSGHGKTRAASLPSLFWRGWTLRLNPHGHFDPLSYRHALSLLLQITGLGDLDYTGARALLGQPPASSAVCAHFTKKLRQTATLEPVLSTLGQIADKLDEHPAPVDYGRRRRWRRISAASLNRAVNDSRVGRDHGRVSLAAPITVVW